MNTNYCQIVPPMEIYPSDISRIIELLETTLYPKNQIDQELMKGITNFLHNKIAEYETKQAQQFKDILDNSVTIINPTEEAGNWTVVRQKKKRGKK